MVTLNLVTLNMVQQFSHLLLPLEHMLSSMCRPSVVLLQRWRIGSETLTRVTEGLLIRWGQGPGLAGLALISGMSLHQDW